MLEYTPLALNDAGDNMGSSEKLLAGNGEAIGNRQSALHHCRPWLVHLGILSLYTIAFLALSTHVLVQNQTEDCFLQESIYCAFQYFYKTLAKLISIRSACTQGHQVFHG